jgi:hypothetical protein
MVSGKVAHKPQTSYISHKNTQQISRYCRAIHTKVGRKNLKNCREKITKGMGVGDLEGVSGEGGSRGAGG